MDASEMRVEFGEPLGMQPLTPAPAASQPAQQQQQTSVVMLNSSLPEPPPLLIQSFVGHIVLACCTFWCCGAAFGLAAFILAVKAQNLSTSPNVADRLAARQLGKTSMWVSIAGIVIGTVAIIVVACAIWALAYEQSVQQQNACIFSVNGRCFAVKEDLAIDDCNSKGYYYDSVTDLCYH